MKSRLAAVLLSLLATSTVACVQPPASVTAKADGEWVSGPVDLRKVTALVRVAPPARLRAQMEVAASSVGDADVADFFRMHASGGFGSGFLVLHKSARGTAAFVVTNRHVIAGAENAEITFGDGTTYKDCEIVYANPTADIAVVALPESATRAFGHGLRPAVAPANERLTVVATGFPGVNGKPSFQVTDGKISNTIAKELKK